MNRRQRPGYPSGTDPRSWSSCHWARCWEGGTAAAVCPRPWLRVNRKRLMSEGTVNLMGTESGQGPGLVRLTQAAVAAFQSLEGPRAQPPIIIRAHPVTRESEAVQNDSMDRKKSLREQPEQAFYAGRRP